MIQACVTREKIRQVVLRKRKTVMARYKMNSSHCGLARKSRVGLYSAAGLIALTMFAALAGGVSANSLDREKSDVSLAETAIQYQLAVWNTPVSSNLSAEAKYGYIGVPAWELALALIAARDSARSLTGLARLVRYKTDAHMSESMTCAILSKGKRIEPYLAGLSAETLQAQCTDEMDDLFRRTNGKFSDRISMAACQSTAEIRRKVETLLKSISGGDECE